MSEHDNPYSTLIESTSGDSTQIQACYESHRRTRNVQQRQKLLDHAFEGVLLDPILQKLDNPQLVPGYVDPRNCLVFWARPPGHVCNIVENIQKKLLGIAPHLWLMPRDNLHMTVLEMAHSRSAEEIAQMIELMRSKVPDITDHTFSHRARLVKPMICYDQAAIALSFVPAAGEDAHNAATDDRYSYHHLRRDIFGLSSRSGVPVASRYVLPSAHLTLARFITDNDFSPKEGDSGNSVPSPEKMQNWIKKIEELNRWLEVEYWTEASATSAKGNGQWVVGEERGLDCRFGTVWYGGGETLHLGRGF